MFTFSACLMISYVFLSSLFQVPPEGKKVEDSTKCGTGHIVYHRLIQTLEFFLWRNPLCDQTRLGELKAGNHVLQLTRVECCPIGKVEGIGFHLYISISYIAQDLPKHRAHPEGIRIYRKAILHFCE